MKDQAPTEGPPGGTRPPTASTSAALRSPPLHQSRFAPPRAPPAPAAPRGGARRVAGSGARGGRGAAVDGRERVRDSHRVASSEEDARLVIVDEVAGVAFVQRDDAAGGEHGFEQRVADVGQLVCREKYVRGPEVTLHFRLRYAANEGDDIA